MPRSDPDPTRPDKQTAVNRIVNSAQSRKKKGIIHCRPEKRPQFLFRKMMLSIPISTPVCKPLLVNHIVANSEENPVGRVQSRLPRLEVVSGMPLSTHFCKLSSNFLALF